MARKMTKSYSEEFRRNAVKLADQPDKTAREVAESLGIHPNQIYNWRTHFKKLSKGQINALVKHLGGYNESSSNFYRSDYLLSVICE